jgi:hypothetical protein
MEKYIAQVVLALVNRAEVIKATKYVSPTQIIRATKRLYGKKLIRDRVEIMLTIGKPNYVEREFVKMCKKAGEPFPVKHAQLKLYNPKPKRLRGRKLKAQ